MSRPERRIPTITEFAQRQDGVAIVTAILVMIVAVGLGIAIWLAAKGIIDRTHSRSDAIMARSAADMGIDMYVSALNGDTVGEFNGFVLDPPAMNLIKNGCKPPLTCTVVANASLPGNLKVVSGGTMGVPPANQLTMQVQSASATTIDYWQMYALKAPGPTFVKNSGYKVIAYFRGWATSLDGSIVARPRILRVEVRAGRFADFQVIADGPISFVDGARIDGRVHTNGFDDSVFGVATPPAYIAPGASGAGTITCTKSARFTSTKGAIDAAGLGCPDPNGQKEEDTGVAINMLRVDEAANRISRHCNTTGWAQIACLDGQANTRGTVERGDDYYRVTLSGSTVTVVGSSTNSYTSSAKGLVVMLDNNVEISGMLSGAARTTILAYDKDLSDNGRVTGFSGASITIKGSTGLAAPATQPSDSLGLMAQGDIVLGIDGAGAMTGCEVGMDDIKLNAAMVAMSGGLTIPPRWKVPQPPPGAAAPKCAELTIEGSIAGHYTPLVHSEIDACMVDSNGDVLVDDAGEPLPCTTKFEIGYTARTYRYDPHLYDNPPPYYPLTGPWQSETYQDANEDCFSNTGDLLDPYCT